MPLILTAPNANPIRTYKNGVKVIRLHEFLGPARGTLSTESDPMSLCGTVIRDTQTVSYSGSNPNKTIATNLKNSGVDTVRIHSSDLNLSDEFIYQVFLGLRGEGSVDPTVQNSTHNFTTVGANAATVMLLSSNASFTTYFGPAGSTVAPKPLTNPYYKIFTAGTTFVGTFTEGQEWLILRAGTGTGGSYEWLLDTMYLVPYTVPETSADIYTDGHLYEVLYDGDFEAVYDVKTSTYDIDRDSDPITWDGDLDGQFSVMNSAPSLFCPSDGSSVADYQVGENEKTMPNVYPRFASVPISNEVSVDITLFAGSHYIPSHNIDTDSFSRTTAQALNTYIGESDQNRVWTTSSDHPLQASSPNASIYCNGSQLVFQYGKYDRDFPFFFPVIGNEANPADSIAVVVGTTSTEVGTGSTTTGHETLNDMLHCTLEVMVSTDHVLVAGFDMWAGFADGDSIAGVTVEIPTQGSFGARTSGPLLGSLMYYPGLASDRNELPPDSDYLLNRSYIDGPDNIGTYTANTWIRIKVEKSWYRIRGKAWFDGDSEPDWLWEGHIPSGNASTTPYDAFEYPYEDDTDKGAEERGRGQRVPILGVSYWRPYEDITGSSMEFTSHPVRVTSTYWDDFSLDYEAYGEDPTDVHLRVKKHDDSIDFGQTTIGYESQRCIIAPTARYNTPDGSGRDGVSVTLWKEEGAPDTQASCIGYAVEKAVIGGPVWLNFKFRPWENNELSEP